MRRRFARTPGFESRGWQNFASFPTSTAKIRLRHKIPHSKVKVPQRGTAVRQVFQGSERGCLEREQCLEIRHRLRQRVHFSPNLYVISRPVARGAFENCAIGAWYSRSRPFERWGSRGFNSRGRGNFQKASKTRIFVQKLPRKRKNAPGRCIFQGGRVGRILRPGIFLRKWLDRPGFSSLEGPQPTTPGNTDLS